MPTINGTAQQDFLYDTTGDDALNGLGGGDRIYVTGGQDTADGGASNDVLYVDYSASAAAFQVNAENNIGEADNAGPDGVTFSNFEAFNVQTGSGDDVIRTFFRPDTNTDVIVSGNDTIVLNGGNDIAAGGQGNDRIFGGAGNDTIDGDGALRGKFGGNLGDRVFSGNDQLFGGEGDDIIHGGAGIDLLDGGVGDDRLIGDGGIFTGIDSTAFGGPGYSVQEAVGDDLTSGGDTILGGAGNDYIDGNAGDDFITGGTGNDTVIGGLGNDTAYVNVSTDGADNVNLGAGNDIVQVTANAPGQVRVTLTSAEVGNGSSNDAGTMANQDGLLAVRLQGEDGSDGLTGDIGRYDDESITFVAAEGTTFDVRDLVAGTQRGEQFNAVTLGSTNDDTLTAVLEGRSYYINAGMGNDTVTGGTASDFLVGGAGDDTLDGGDANDSFIGGGGNDVIIGGRGDDRMDGGLGDDTYYVQSSRDMVIEATDGGTDLIYSTTNVNLANMAAVENATLTGMLDRNLTGNDLSNVLTGNSGANILNGGLGADTLIGGFGNDTYSVDNAGDTVTEAAGGGADRVNASITFSAQGQDIENVTLTGSAAVNAAGNDLDNVLIGNDANNGLFGGLGADRLEGGLGNDTYNVDNLGDVVVENFGAGTDVVNSSITLTLSPNVEILNLTGSGNINAIGNDLNNVLRGNDGANTLFGGEGRDNLTGGAGADRFDFNTTSGTSLTNSDRITDLTNDDRIDLSSIDADTNMSGNQNFSLVDAFSGTAGEVTLSYNESTGFTSLLMDTNGDSIADGRIVIDSNHTDFTNFLF